MLSFDQWITIGYFIITVVVLFVGTNIARSYIKIRKELNDLKNFELNVQVKDIDDGIKMLDKLIADTISDYVILHRSNNNVSDHINSEEEIKIVHEVADLVGKRISPTLLTKLQIYYNSATIPDVIGDKVFIQVSAFVIGNNSIKEDKKE